MNDYADRARSWSQLSDYESCPQKFYLKRVAKVWARPAAWLAMGTGVHAAAEAHGKGEATELPDMLEVAQKAYRATINADLEKTPNAGYWFSSGPYKGRQDILRRYGLLGPHLEKYLKDVNPEKDSVRTPWVPPADLNEGSPEGGVTPAVEWGFRLNLGGIEVIGYADRIDDLQTELEVIDVKTGSKHPTVSDAAQLKLAALAAEEVTGEPVARGRYLMTKKGLKSRQHDLTLISTESLTARFRKLDDGVKADAWDPKPGPDCERCEVLTSCAAGQKHLRRG